MISIQAPGQRPGSASHPTSPSPEGAWHTSPGQRPGSASHPTSPSPERAWHKRIQPLAHGHAARQRAGDMHGRQRRPYSDTLTRPAYTPPFRRASSWTHLLI